MALVVVKNIRLENEAEDKRIPEYKAVSGVILEVPKVG
jgi:hypothetical protein